MDKWYDSETIYIIAFGIFVFLVLLGIGSCIRMVCYGTT
jgi:hypothetical protein